MARKDYDSWRVSQAQGIERAKLLGKFKGKQADLERHKQVLEYRSKGYSIAETAKLTGYSHVQVCRIVKKRGLT